MKDNKSRINRETTKSKKRRHRRVALMCMLLISMIIIGTLYLSKRAQQNKNVVSQGAGSEWEQTAEENTVVTPYYRQEAGVIESILTETNHIVYSLHYPKLSNQAIDEDLYQMVKEMIQKAENAEVEIGRPEDRAMLYLNYDSYLVGQNIVSIIFYVEYTSTRLETPEKHTISRYYAMDTGKRLTKDELVQGDDLTSDSSEVTGIKEEEESPVMESETSTIDSNKPMIALTFDDGPNAPVTNRILDALAEYDSRATFFVVGNRLRNYPDTLKRILSEGSELGSHTYNHKSLTLLKSKEIKKELDAVDDRLLEMLGTKTQTLRPPYGAVNDLVRKAAKKPLIYWSIDTEDWKHRNAKTIVKHVMSQVQDGDIILFHDLYDTTAAAIERLVPKLIEEGYQLVTVSELFEAKGIPLENGIVYYNAR